jgi:hypothetical protein
VRDGAATGPPLCGECKRHGRLVSLHKALANGFPLAALRAIGPLVYCAGTPYFAKVHLRPSWFDPGAARRDANRLKRERTAARPALDRTRLTLMREETLRPWREGAHVDAVARGLLSPRQAVDAARAARDAWTFLCRPDVRAERKSSSREVQEALEACVGARLGDRLMRFAEEVPPPDISKRALTIAVVNRVLGDRHDEAHAGVGLLLPGAARLPWSMTDHAYVVPSVHRRVFRLAALLQDIGMHGRLGDG